jgi:hypothetical protein
MTYPKPEKGREKDLVKARQIMIEAGKKKVAD